VSLQFPSMKTTGAKPSMPAPAPPSSPDAISVRLIRPDDPIPEITALLHRAYRKQTEMGLRPLAGRQDDPTTARRCASGECYLALMGEGASTTNGTRKSKKAAGKIVGVILFHEIEDAEGPPWFRRKDVDYFSQFAVDPDIQGRGIGGMLLDTAERRARECGSVEIGLSMAEPDTDLMNYYLKRGYRLVEHWQWPYTNYRSAILSKPLK
jgi:GNAT superfamily N-acetyltransferase